MPIYKLCVSAGLLCLLISSSAVGQPDPNKFKNLEVGPSYEEALEEIEKKYPASRHSNTRTIVIYYCWPDSKGSFHPLSHSACSGMVRSDADADADADAVKATYSYFPRGKENVAETHPSFLEGLLSLDLPQDFNLAVSGKTPYEIAYENYNSNVVDRRIKLKPVDDHRFQGLQLYLRESDFSKLSNERERVLSKIRTYWVSINDYETWVGNPFLVSCNPTTQCRTQLDLGNGWVLGVRFPERILENWEEFLKNLEISECHIWR